MHDAVFYALLRELRKRCGQGVTARDLADALGAASAGLVRDGYLADVKESLSDLLEGVEGRWPAEGREQVVARASERLSEAARRARL